MKQRPKKQREGGQNKTMKDEITITPKHQQIECLVCKSRRQQIISLLYNDERSLINLLCMNCGMLSSLNLGAGLITPEPIHGEDL